jgi:hypothetical protein
MAATSIRCFKMAATPPAATPLTSVEALRAWAPPLGRDAAASHVGWARRPARPPGPRVLVTHDLMGGYREDAALFGHRHRYPVAAGRLPAHAAAADARAWTRRRAELRRRRRAHWRRGSIWTCSSTLAIGGSLCRRLCGPTPRTATACRYPIPTTPSARPCLTVHTQVLGTYIAEWEDGRRDTDALLADRDPNTGAFAAVPRLGPAPRMPDVALTCLADTVTVAYAFSAPPCSGAHVALWL